MKPKARIFRFCPALFSILTVGLASSSLAGSFVWQNSGPTDNWSTAGADTNWFVDGGATLTAWADSNAAVFAGATGETVVLTGTVAPTTTTVNDNGNWTLGGAGVLGGTGSLIKNGTGTLTLANTVANTYAAGTTINGGTISLGTGGTGAATSTVGALGAGPVAVNGGTLKLWLNNSNAANAPWVIPNAVTVNGGTILGEDGIHSIGGPVTVGAGGATFSAKWGGKTLAFTGGISGAGDVVIRRAADGGGEAAATVIYNGATTYTGNTTVTSGILQVDGNQNFNRLRNNAPVVVNGGAFEIRGVNSLPSAANSVDVTANQDATVRVVSGGSTAIGAGGSSHGHLRNVVLNGAIISLEYSGGGFAYNGDSFQLNGGLTVGGTVPSRVNIGANTNSSVQGIALGGTTAHVFTIADATANENVDFIVNGELEDSDGGAGALTKEGLGTMSLTFPNTYTGATLINAGGIVLAGNGSLTSAVTVNATGSFGIQTPGKTLPALTVNTGAALALPAATGGTTTVTNALTFGAGAVVGVTPILNSSATVGAVFDLVTAGSVSGTATFNTLLPVTSRVTGTTALNGNKLQFTVTTAGANLVWNGGTGVWETAGAPNFLNGAVSDSFRLYDAVTFNDSIGAGDHTVTLTGVLTPSAITVNNSTGNYTFDGAGSIIGGSLTKSGTSNLVLGGTATYGLTGAVTVAGGTLDLGAHVLGSASTLVLDGGTLANGTLSAGSTFDVRSGTSTAILAGSGVLTKSTAGTVTLNAVNTFTGGAVISGGTLVAATNQAIGTGATTVNAGGTLQLDTAYSLRNTMTVNGGTVSIKKGTNFHIDPPTLVISGTGSRITSHEGTGTTASIDGFDVNSTDVRVETGTTNALIDSSVVIGTNIYGIRFDVNGTGELTVAGPITGTGAAAGAVETGTLVGTDITAVWKRGTGTLTLTGASTFTASATPNPGATAIQDGVLRLSGGADRLPVTSAVYLGATSNTNGKLVLDGISQTITGLAVTGTGTTNAVVGGSTTLSTLTVNNTNDYVYSGAVGGAGPNENSLAIAKSGTGTLTLSGVYSHAGDTTVSGGKLILGTATLSDEADVRLNGTGVIELPAGANDTVAELWIDGVPKATGTWGSPTSAATNKDAHFSGTGIVTVLSTGTPPAYVNWANDQGLILGENAGKGDNPDQDGLNNLGEFAFNDDPRSSSSSGKVVSKVVAGVATLTLPVRQDAGTFQVAGDGKGVLSSVGGEVRYRIQASTDLVNWTLGVSELTPAVTAGLPTPLPAGWTYRTFQVPAGNPKVFLRAKVEGQ